MVEWWRASVLSHQFPRADFHYPVHPLFTFLNVFTAPWTSSYGEFQESVLSVKCTYEGQAGYFAPIAFLNSRSSIPAGREIYGTPKVSAEIEVGMDERVMFADT